MTTTSGSSNQPLISMEGVSKVYGSGQAAVHALRGINLHIEQGEFVTVMGPSGSGKSTCMHILGCLDTPTAGLFRFAGLDVGKMSRDQRALLRRHTLGFIFQNFNLLSRTSALENVELPLIYRGTPAHERRERAMEALRLVGLEKWSHYTPGELSGGMQQCVAIARAIVTGPKVLLADEPTGNLDSAHGKEIMKLLTSFNHKLGITVVLVTHEADMAVYGRRRINFIDGRIDTGDPAWRTT